MIVILIFNGLKKTIIILIKVLHLDGIYTLLLFLNNNGNNRNQHKY